MDVQRDESAESLIAVAGDHGHRVTPVMLKKWRARGLLPRPTTRGLGRPSCRDDGQKRGSDAIYPLGTTAQLLRLLEIRAEGGRFDPERALWRLWWENFAIEPSYIWNQLDGKLQPIELWSEKWRALTSDERIEWMMLPDRLPDPLRTIRDRVGRRGLECVMDVLIRIAAGELTIWEDKEERSSVINGLGLDRAKRDRIGVASPWLRGMLDEQLRELATTIRPDRLREALDATKEENALCNGRDELQAFLGLLYTVRLTVEPMLGAGALGLGLIPHPNDLCYAIMPTLFLGWFAFRRDPTLYAGYETLMAFAESGASLTFFIDLMRNADTQKLPRRLEPSGSTAQGDQSPCTTSLASPSRPPARETAS